MFLTVKMAFWKELVNPSDAVPNGRTKLDTFRQVGIEKKRGEERRGDMSKQVEDLGDWEQVS